MHFLAWIKQLLLQDVGLLCSLWFIAFTTICHFLESWLRCFLTPRFRWWDTAREPDYIQSSKHAWAIFCCVYFCPRYSGTCSTLYSKAYIYIYSTHTCHQQSTCQRPKIHTRQMGLIPQIFISDPAYPECTESQPALPNATMVDSWLSAHSFLLGLANKQVRSLHLGAGDTSVFHYDGKGCRQRKQQVVRPKSAHSHDLSAIERKDIWCAKKNLKFS